MTLAPGEAPRPAAAAARRGLDHQRKADTRGLALDVGRSVGRGHLVPRREWHAGLAALATGGNATDLLR